MNTIVTMNLLISTALIVAGSKLEATEGQNVTISFDIDEVEKADEVRIAFKQDGKENAVVIAQHPWTYDEPPPAGVSLLVEKRHVNITIRHVSISRNSGLYTARAFFGKKVSEINATLVINIPQSSSSPAPLHTATPNPLNSTELLWLYVLFPVVIIIILCVCFWRCSRMCFSKKKKEPENGCSTRVSVPMNSCEEKAEPLVLKATLYNATFTRYNKSL